MKKYLVVLMSFFVSLSIYGQDEAKSNNALGKFSVEMSPFGSSAQHNIREVGFKTNVSYEFVPRLYVLAHYEESKGLYDGNGVKTHFSSNALGGGLGYTVLGMSTGGKVDARLLVAQTIGSKDWKKTLYSVELSWKLREGISPVLGLGFSHAVSHTSGVPNMNMVYGSIGFRF
ncbi:hypothetical protein [Prevotella dentasini]